MSLQAAYSEPSDEERLLTPSERQSSMDRSARRRSTRACDQCRRTKSKCERDKTGPAKQACRGCVALGLSCTYAGPSHKRGPPKGYILAIERRLHQVEALLGTIIGSEDPRARGLLHDLSQDQLASQIIQRVDVGPFGPRGRVAHPFGSTKEDFLASIMTGIGEESSESSKSSHTLSPRSDSLALVSPSSSWQDGLQRLLLSRASGTTFPQNSSEAGVPGSLLTDPRTRRASFPLMSNNVTFPTKVPPISPVMSLSSLASFPTSTGSERVGWDSIEGLEKIDSESGESEDSETRIPTRVEDAYVDEDAQLRIANRISGLQILNQCQRILTGRREEPFECPWPSADRRSGQGFTLPSAVHQGPQEHNLVQCYFEYVHPMFPVINRANFVSLYNQKLNNIVQGSLQASELARASFDVLLLSICSISSRYLEAHSRDNDSTEYCSQAIDLIHSLAGQTHPLLCQSLLLLGYRSVGVGSLESAWSYIGMAARMAESLGLHRAADDLTSSGLDLVLKDEQQMRQQTWTGCLIADRFISVLLGRPTAIHMKDFDTPPVDISQLMNEEPIYYSAQHGLGLRAEQVSETTALLCFNGSRSLSSVVASIMDELYPIVQPTDTVLELRAKHLEHRLTQWRQSLPVPLQFDPTRIGVLPPPCVLELHVQYWWTVILLHRAFVHGPLMQGFYSGPEGAQSKALAVCREAAGQISSIITLLDNHSLKFASAFTPGYILSIGIIDVLTLTILHNDDQASSRLRSSLATLQRMETTWPIARAVQDLLDRTMSAPAPTPVATPSSPTTLRHKRSAGEVFSDDEHVDHGMKKMTAQQLPTQFVKDHSQNYDSLGRMLGLDSGLGFITSQPYPGFQYRQPHLETPASVHSFPAIGYSSETFSAVTSPSSSFGLW
ncbi:hypothetical protein AcW1_005038 [Taiwanofungus camphoratus]|nr:hypothetical protein AcW2_005952 [Antrodia cinnamomea]KAI0940270.1 hypothetical protein AcV5_001424 [Antrodia cinnamomea]KAI0941183.1 hypothetical protein AcV7_002820 [Antrodia cinnamomea]KAI0960554.1 hypothetical protein AcW1_005038 [Antrodia cinnamomea]